MAVSERYGAGTGATAGFATLSAVGALGFLLALSQPVLPVLKTSAGGSADDPYVVQTLASDFCRPKSFSVLTEVLPVSIPEPEKVDIRYNPKPV